MQERAAGPPPIMAWALLFLGIVGIIIGLVQAPGVFTPLGNNTTDGTETPDEGPSAQGETGGAAIDASTAGVTKAATNGEPAHSRPVSG